MVRGRKEEVIRERGMSKERKKHDESSMSVSLSGKREIWKAFG